MGEWPFNLSMSLNSKISMGTYSICYLWSNIYNRWKNKMIFLYIFLASLGILAVTGFHLLLESRKQKRPIQKIEMDTSNQMMLTWVDSSQNFESDNNTLLRSFPRKEAQKRSMASGRQMLLWTIQPWFNRPQIFGFREVSTEQPYHHKRLQTMCVLRNQSQ